MAASFSDIFPLFIPAVKEYPNSHNRQVIKKTLSSLQF